jgi:toxin ParE1/3/4
VPRVPVHLHPAAVDEAAAASQWYHGQSERAGAAFDIELERAIALIGEAPQRWPPYLHGTQRFVLRRFPFFVVYRRTAGGVEVIAVAHAKRQPGYWRGR